MGNTRAKPTIPAGSEPTTRDRGNTNTFTHGPEPTGRTKAQIGAAGTGAGPNEPVPVRRAPKTDRLI